LQAGMEDESAVGIQVTEVAGIEEAVGSERAHRLFRIGKVPRCRVATKQYQADLSRRHWRESGRIDNAELKTRQRRARGVQLCFQRVVVISDGGVAIRLGQAVSGAGESDAHLDERHPLVLGHGAGVALLEGAYLFLG